MTENEGQESQGRIEERIEHLATLIPSSAVPEFYTLIECSYQLGRIHEGLSDHDHEYSKRFLNFLEYSRKKIT